MFLGKSIFIAKTRIFTAHFVFSWTIISRSFICNFTFMNLQLWYSIGLYMLLSCSQPCVPGLHQKWQVCSVLHSPPGGRWTHCIPNLCVQTPVVALSALQETGQGLSPTPSSQPRNSKIFCFIKTKWLKRQKFINALKFIITRSFGSKGHHQVAKGTVLIVEYVTYYI